MIGETFGRYRVVETLDVHPPMGRYLVEDEAGGRFFLKICAKGAAPELHEALEREFRIQSSIEHENVCKALELIKDPDGHLGLVLEHANAGALSDHLHEDRAVPPEVCAGILRGLLTGLASAHEIGVVHRDIKPENILLMRGDGGMRAMLADFGMAKEVDHSEPMGAAGLSMYYQLIGTPGYMSPEQATDAAKVDHRSDLYSVGIVLYELALGKLPFDTQGNPLIAMISGDWERPEPDSQPAWVMDMLDGLLVPSARHRLQSAAEVLEMLPAISE